MNPATEALDLDVVVKADQQNADGHAKSAVQVGGGHHTQVVQTEHFPDSRQQINRQEVHGVHQEDPEEHGQRHRSHKLAGFGTMHDALGLVSNHLDEDLDGGLEPPGNAGGCLAGSLDQEHQRNDTQADREEEGVQVPHAPVDDRSLRMTGGVQVGEVVDNVFARGRGVCFGASAHGQVFTKNANKFAFSATTNPINNANQWTSGYTSRTVANNPTVDAILKNSPTKNSSGYDAAGRLETKLRRRANNKLGRTQAAPPNAADNAPRVPEINPAANATRIVAPICRNTAFNIGSLRGTSGNAPSAVRKTCGW